MSGGEHLDRVMLRAGLFGLVVVAGSLFWRSWAISLGAAAGVGLALVNFWAQRRLVGSLIASRRSGAAAGLFIVKLGVLFGVLYALIAVAGLDAIALMAGFSVLVVAISISGHGAAGDEPEAPGAKEDGDPV